MTPVAGPLSLQGLELVVPTTAADTCHSANSVYACVLASTWSIAC